MVGSLAAGGEDLKHRNKLDKEELHMREEHLDHLKILFSLFSNR